LNVQLEIPTAYIRTHVPCLQSRIKLFETRQERGQIYFAMISTEHERYMDTAT